MYNKTTGHVSYRHKMKLHLLYSALFASGIASTHAFTVGRSQSLTMNPNISSSTQLAMGLDLVTALRAEWISAAICTNQIPRTAKSVLQLGTEDGRIVNFVPNTIEEILTSSASADGELSISAQRALKQQRERRTSGPLGQGATVRYLNQPADNLKDLKDNSVDCVVSLQAAQVMKDNGQDWKRSILEGGRVLKPGGRFIFVEQTEIDGEKYVDALAKAADGNENEEGELETYPMFELVGYDDVDLVIVPHIAGVVTKTEYAGLTQDQIEKKAVTDKKDRLADLSISAFEKGLKRRKKGKKKQKAEEETSSSSV